MSSYISNSSGKFTICIDEYGNANDRGGSHLICYDYMDDIRKANRIKKYPEKFSLTVCEERSDENRARETRGETPLFYFLRIENGDDFIRISFASEPEPVRDSYSVSLSEIIKRYIPFGMWVSIYMDYTIEKCVTTNVKFEISVNFNGRADDPTVFGINMAHRLEESMIEHFNNDPSIRDRFQDRIVFCSDTLTTSSFTVIDLGNDDEHD